jgi:GT2 family glycosyltransferase
MLTIAIPTYERGAVLCDTIAMLLALEPRADEILIIDQTVQHPPDVAERLALWQRGGAINMLRLPEPSITQAMNTALTRASQPYVLFLDDDIVPAPDLVAAHRAALRESGVWAVAGQVLQPGEEPRHYDDTLLHAGTVRDLDFRFHHDTACDVENVMAGNLSVDRARALGLGGFDENYINVAYRFETDFARRLIAAGGRIRFQPAASIRHLKAPGGGVRTWGDHRTDPSPMHSVGDYYFALRHAPRFWRYVGRRLARNLATRYHLAHPWTLPAKVTGELRGLALARRLARGGRRLLDDRPK